ncbi:MAG: hypothetical protein ACTSQE_03715 [Candidatus Heimdallarchaeaceae archaeon]
MSFDLKSFLENADLANQKHTLSNINQYLYTNYEGIGKIRVFNKEFDYFSDFHKFWEKNHKEILNPQIHDSKCEKVADVLHELLLKYGETIFTELYDTLDLNKEEICRVRFFTANQDFRGSRNFIDFAEIFRTDPSIFDVEFILNEPNQFLAKLGLHNLSQSDKRVKYAQTSAEFLHKNNLEPYDLFTYANEDYLKLREILTGLHGSGFGNKKTDMFLRDMHQLNVWVGGKNYDKIDVASDINTLKVALRTGILTTDIPLLSSFLDIFCYQYELLDKMNAKAWRRVWEIWTEKYPKEAIESPCQMDYLIYKIIGKELCNDNLCLYKCEVDGHTFYWHSSRNRTCQVCYSKKKEKNPAVLVFKDLPCKYEEGKIYVARKKTIQQTLPGLTECPFADVCESKDPKFIKFQPPKSISIMGRTGWTTAMTKTNEGGGGLMA